MSNKLSNGFTDLTREEQENISGGCCSCKNITICLPKITVCKPICVPTPSPCVKPPTCIKPIICMPVSSLKKC